MRRALTSDAAHHDRRGAGHLADHGLHRKALRAQVPRPPDAVTCGVVSGRTLFAPLAGAVPAYATARR